MAERGCRDRHSRRISQKGKGPDRTQLPATQPAALWGWRSCPGPRKSTPSAKAWAGIRGICGLMAPMGALGPHPPSKLQPGTHTRTNARKAAELRGSLPGCQRGPQPLTLQLHIAVGSPREEGGLWPRCRGAEGSPPPSPRCPAERTQRQDGWKTAWECDEQTSARPPHRAPASLEGKGSRGAVAHSLPRGNRCRRPGPGISRHCHGVPRDLQVAEAAGSRPAPAVPPRIILGILF